MVSSAIWEKHARVSFSKTSKAFLKNSRVHIFPKLHEKSYYYLLIIGKEMFEKSMQFLHRDRSLRPNFRDNSMFIFSMHKSKVDGTP